MTNRKIANESKAMILLRKHIRSHYENQKDFAEALGVSPVQLSVWLAGKLMPSLEIAVRIEALTELKGDAVRCKDWVDAR